MKCELAKPTKLITLTVNPEYYVFPRDAYDKTRRQVTELAKKLRKPGKEFEYLRVLEVTKKGWPHYHLVARTPYIPQKQLSDLWASMTGAPIVDIRTVQQSTNVFKYVLKYLCKQTYVPWTNRRISWTKNFFPKPEEQPHRQNPYINRRRCHHHPADALEKYADGKLITEVKVGIWHITDQPS
jgi:hypothetical protein